MHAYYLVINEVSFNRISFPEFLTCALKGGKFVIIDDLNLYLSKGEGLSEKFISSYDDYIKIRSNVDYKKTLSSLFN